MIILCTKTTRTAHRNGSPTSLSFQMRIRLLARRECRHGRRQLQAHQCSQKRLFWEDMLACIEFKRPTKKLSKCPLSYELYPVSFYSQPMLMLPLHRCVLYYKLPA